MSLRILVFVGLRCYAIYAAVQVLAVVPYVVPLAMAGPASGISDRLLLLVRPMGLALTAVFLWRIADRLAARTVQEANPTMDRFNLTMEDAYTFAFVFLGLYFILSSIASLLQQLYYLVAVVAQLPESDPQRSLALFQLYGPAITFIAGLASLLAAPFWSRNLIAFGVKRQS
jgi:hypothetical protein